MLASIVEGRGWKETEVNL